MARVSANSLSRALPCPSVACLAPGSALRHNMPATLHILTVTLARCSSPLAAGAEFCAGEGPRFQMRNNKYFKRNDLLSLLLWEQKPMRQANCWSACACRGRMRSGPRNDGQRPVSWSGWLLLGVRQQQVLRLSAAMLVSARPAREVVGYCELQEISIATGHGDLGRGHRHHLLRQAARAASAVHPHSQAPTQHAGQSPSSPPPPGCWASAPARTPPPPAWPPGARPSRLTARPLQQTWETGNHAGWAPRSACPGPPHAPHKPHQSRTPHWLQIRWRSHSGHPASPCGQAIAIGGSGAYQVAACASRQSHSQQLGQSCSCQIGRTHLPGLSSPDLADTND